MLHYEISLHDPFGLGLSYGDHLSEVTAEPSLPFGHLSPSLSGRGTIIKTREENVIFPSRVRIRGSSPDSLKFPSPKYTCVSILIMWNLFGLRQIGQQSQPHTMSFPLKRLPLKI